MTTATTSPAHATVPRSPTALVSAEGAPGFLIDGVSWEEYEGLLDWIGDRRIWVNYDRGRLEIMSPSTEHEFGKEGLSSFVKLLALELGLPIRSGGAPTFRSRLAERGMEPDECFWLENEPGMRGKMTWDVAIDPPPDLVIEVKRSRTVVDRLAILAALKIPEVWRFDGQSIRVLRLQPEGTYAEAVASAALPGVPVARFVDFVAMVPALGELEAMRAFQAWVRAGFLEPGQPPGPNVLPP